MFLPVASDNKGRHLSSAGGAEEFPYFEHVSAMIAPAAEGVSTGVPRGRCAGESRLFASACDSGAFDINDACSNIGRERALRRRHRA